MTAFERAYDRGYYDAEEDHTLNRAKGSTKNPYTTSELAAMWADGYDDYWILRKALGFIDNTVGG